MISLFLHFFNNNQHENNFSFVFSLIILLLFTNLFGSCSNKIDYNAEYFIGLQKLAEGKEDEARTKFVTCLKKGSGLNAKKSAQILTTMGNIQEKNKACKELLKLYDDEESKLIAVKQFLSADELGTVIQITENLDYEKSDNELLRLRMEALAKKKSTLLESEVYKWFTSRQLSAEHIKFYNQFYTQEKMEVQLSPQDFAVNYRIDVYKRNYQVAYQKAVILFDYINSGKIEPLSQLVSDIGKGYLYGDSNFADNAQFFTEKAELYSDNESEFYWWFYAGRLYDKTEKNYNQAISCFEKAINSTDDKAKKDNALWYKLTTTQKLSLDAVITLIPDFAQQWSDPEYFDDFFEKLVPTLFVNGKWKAFGEIYKNLDGYGSNETVAKYAYIYGRLLQKGLIKSQENIEEETKKAFQRALKSGTEMYYRVLAAYQLGLNERELISALSVYSALQQRSDYTCNLELEELLKGYVTYGFPEKIYSEWLKYYKTDISTDTSLYLADFLSKCSSNNEEFALQSIRIAARAANISERPLTKAELQLVYPKNFSKFVDTYCKKYDINTSVIFALIRSESFFDPNVISSAGAIGLTQLMELTGGDIARKLRKPEYSLTDPETNIEFGTFYFSELVSRCDNSYLQALLSYNAGITRVRRWLNSSIIGFGLKKEMSGDLFVESVPFEETRGYGRKLVPATVMYEWLYGEEHLFAPVVESFIE